MSIVSLIVLTKPALLVLSNNIPYGLKCSELVSQGCLTHVYQMLQMSQFSYPAMTIRLFLSHNVEQFVIISLILIIFVSQ